LAADGLLRLAAITGDSSYEASPRKLLGQLAEIAGQHSSSFANLLGAYERAVTPTIEIALIGDDPDLRHEVFGRLIPASVAVRTEPGAGSDRTPLLADRFLVDGKPTAYVCEGFACRLPVTTPEALRAEIDAGLAARRG
jgi:uncharacterized protein YyaL (SSP411 family)